MAKQKKKYKLIKEYPGSPELGIIAEERYVMKDQPEYWEEVVEKDYEILISRVVPQEILSVKRLSDGEVFTIGDEVMWDLTQLPGQTQFRFLSKDNITSVYNLIPEDYEH